MDWIKRNLLFVVGGVVSLLLMGLAGWYLWDGMGKNAAALEKLNAEYAEMERLSRQNPHPGDDKVNNIAAAREQEKTVREFISQTAGAFRHVPSIPDGTNVDNAMLADSLRRTLASMRKDASGRGVQVATNFYFSFTAQKDRIQFDKPGVLPLARQLGEIKAICDVLFAARVNVLDAIRREKVSADDVASQATTDYLEHTSTTNDVAVISHYEVSVRCFSAEVGALLGGFSSSQNGLIVRAINVEPAVLGATTEGGVPGMNPYQNYPPPPIPGRGLGEEGGMGFGRPGIAPPAATPTGGAPARGGLTTMLDEKQLKVTLLVDVVKLNPATPVNPKK